jgi:hypothetical protein
VGFGVLIVLPVHRRAALGALDGGLAAAAREPACRLLYLLIGVFLFNPFEAMLPCDLNENHTFWGRFVLAWMIVRNSDHHLEHHVCG